MTTSCRAYSTAASGVQAKRLSLGIWEVEQGCSQRSTMVYSPSPSFWPAGLSQLLTLEVEGNQLHDGDISPLAFQPLHSLLYLRMDRNRLRTIPRGLPASLLVSWEPLG
jgi:hypothetical protein